MVARCGTVAYRGQVLPMEEDTVQSVSAVVSEMLQDGMKVIAVAQKKWAPPTISPLPMSKI